MNGRVYFNPLVPKQAERTGLAPGRLDACGYSVSARSGTFFLIPILCYVDLLSTLLNDPLRVPIRNENQIQLSQHSYCLVTNHILSFRFPGP